MSIRIVTDSAADFLPEEAERLGLNIVPLTLNWDGVEYRDAVDITHKEFFDKLVNSDSVPTTSQASPAEFAKVFEKLVSNGDDIIVITISSLLSGTCQSAHIAAGNFEGKVHVVDSLSATVGERLLVLTALDYIMKGMTVDSVVDRLNEDRNNICVMAKLETLEYLKKGGRISSAVAVAGEILSVKPVITIDNGAISLIGKARGSKNGNNLLRKFIIQKGGVDYSRPFCLVYSGTSDDKLREYIDDSKDLWEGKVIGLPTATIGPVIGTHIGPGAIGIAFYI